MQKRVDMHGVIKCFICNEENFHWSYSIKMMKLSLTCESKNQRHLEVVSFLHVFFLVYLKCLQFYLLASISEIRQHNSHSKNLSTEYYLVQYLGIKYLLASFQMIWSEFSGRRKRNIYIYRSKQWLRNSRSKRIFP